ncbi:MAG: methyltransferase domain-containing protein, partial [Bryobacteraceae bacterium]|nr:methyltransferase domain-containing protein [Bryobacteraceae bacterium]
MMNSPAQVFNECAEEYARRFMDLSAYHASLDLFCQAVEAPTAAVFDVACGPGNIPRYLLMKRPGFRVLGVDLAPNMLRLARACCPGAEFRMIDARDIRHLGRRFDALTCGFCLPYLSKPEAIGLIADAAALLHVGGVLYLSTMEGDYTRSGPTRSTDGRHELIMYFHEAKYLTAALFDNGFDVFHTCRRELAGENGTTATDLILLARFKGESPKAD